MRANAPWSPGSFTKNFSWGKSLGMGELYASIRIGFNETLQSVSREKYRSRVRAQGRADLVPVNFFLFNYISGNQNVLLVDELVFQALTAPHSARFDNLALFALNFSRAGAWRGASADQRYPALWAFHYIIDRVAKDLSWDTGRISANDIRTFLKEAPLYRADTDDKVSTNLNFVYRHGGLKRFNTPKVERWWVDALFLALDRLIADRAIDGQTTPSSMLPGLLMSSGFPELTGPTTPAKNFAMAHILGLYSVCAGIERFSEESIRNRTAVLLPNYQWQTPNDDRPQGALHPTNPRILKSIPRSCAALAESAGFQIVYADDLDSFDVDDFIERRARDVVGSLKRDGIAATMSSDDLHKLMRGE